MSDSGFQPKDIHHREKNHEQDGHQVLRVDSHIHVAQNHGPQTDRRNFPNVQDPTGGRNCGKEDSQKLAKSHTHRRNRPRLNHQKKGPAIEKPPQRPQRLAQINVLPAGPRHHRRQLAIAERANDGHEPRHRPRPNQQRRRVHFACNLRRNNKDARADHRSHDQHGGASQAQALDQFLILRTMKFPVAACDWLRCRCTQDPPKNSVAPAARRLSLRQAQGRQQGHLAPACPEAYRSPMTLPQNAEKFLC